MARVRDPLFHVVVALGAAAAAGACGETNRSPATHSSTGAENAGAAPSGGSGGGGEGARIAVAGVGGDLANVPAAGAPTDPCAGGVANVTLSTDAGAAGQGGDVTDCPSPQLRCATYSPTPTDCSCDRTSPLSACDCLGEHIWDCFKFDPPTGCQCSIATGPR